jgi:methyl-accepting chemotaxis protein
VNLKTYFFVASSIQAIAFLMAALLIDFTTTSTKVFVFTVIGAACIAWSTTSMTRSIRRGIRLLEDSLSTGDTKVIYQVGLREFAECSLDLTRIAEKWADLDRKHREQLRALTDIHGLIAETAGEDPITSDKVRSQLAHMASGVSQHIKRAGKAAVQVESLSDQLSENTESQGCAIVKASTYLEQLSDVIGSVHSNADAALKQNEKSTHSLQDIINRISNLQNGLTTLEGETRSSERKLSDLADPAKQATGIVGVISDLAARTNLLALNASIESIRAGEQGRGFALVADEVRKLSDQASEASREITALLDLIEITIQDATARLNNDREKLHAEREKVLNILESMSQFLSDSQHPRKNIEAISALAKNQIGLANEILAEIETISDQARDNRNHLQNTNWSARSIAQIDEQLFATIERLSECINQIHSPRDFESHAVDSTLEKPPTVIAGS